MTRIHPRIAASLPARRRGHDRSVGTFAAPAAREQHGHRESRLSAGPDENTRSAQASE
jgi:hypothetical protein